MIRYLVNYFLKIAKEHNEVNGFTYGYPDKVLGNGEDFYPHIYLEEPLYISTNKVTNGTVDVVVNIDVLCNDKRESKLKNQRKAEKICYDIITYINTKENTIGLKVGSYSMLSLSNYTDDASYGIRITLDCTAYNEINYCEYNFDEDNDLMTEDILNDIKTENPSACNTSFTFKLNDINFE